MFFVFRKIWAMLSLSRSPPIRAIANPAIATGLPVILNAKSARESKKKQHGHTAPTPAKQAEGVGRRYRWQLRRLEVNEMTRFGPFKPKWTFLQTKKIPVGLRAWPRADCPSSRPCGAVQVCVLFVFFSDCSPTSHESRAAGVWPGKATRKRRLLFRRRPVPPWLDHGPKELGGRSFQASVMRGDPNGRMIGLANCGSSH